MLYSPKLRMYQVDSSRKNHIKNHMIVCEFRFMVNYQTIVCLIETANGVFGVSVLCACHVLNFMSRVPSSYCAFMT